MDQLTPLDAAFLEIEDEDPHASLAIASVAILEGPAPSQQALLSAIVPRLSLIHRYRQKVREVPLDLGPPRWVDDTRFEPTHHFRRIALPTPGDEAALCDLVALIMAQRLPRDRPLWEFWIIEGLAGDRWAILSKVHHCLADGVSGSALHAALFSGEASPSVFTSPDEAAAPDPGTLRLILDAVGGFVLSPVDQLRYLGQGLLSPKKLGRYVSDTVRGLAAMAAVLVPAAPSSLSGPLGRQRRYEVAHASLSDVLEISHAFEVTVNDVVLAAIAGAFRDLLLLRGEEPARDTLRTLVPVSVRADHGHDTVDNQISLMLPLLPADIDDPVERLVAVHRRLATLKSSKEAEAGAAMTTTARHGVFALIAWGIRAAAKLPQHNIVTVATNVPGSRAALSLLDRNIVDLYPYVPIALRLRTGVAVLTYCDRMSFGITMDRDSVPETGVLATSIERHLALLVDAARASVAAS